MVGICWNTSFLSGWPIFRCYVSFREGNNLAFYFGSCPKTLVFTGGSRRWQIQTTSQMNKLFAHCCRVCAGPSLYRWWMLINQKIPNTNAVSHQIPYSWMKILLITEMFITLNWCSNVVHQTYHDTIDIPRRIMVLKCVCVCHLILCLICIFCGGTSLKYNPKIHWIATVIAISFRYMGILNS